MTLKCRLQPEKVPERFNPTSKFPQDTTSSSPRRTVSFPNGHHQRKSGQKLMIVFAQSSPHRDVRRTRDINLVIWLRYRCDPDQDVRHTSSTESFHRGAQALPMC